MLSTRFATVVFIFLCVGTIATSAQAQWLLDGRFVEATANADPSPRCDLSGRQTDRTEPTVAFGYFDSAAAVGEAIGSQISEAGPGEFVASGMVVATPPDCVLLEASSVFELDFRVEAPVVFSMSGRLNADEVAEAAVVLARESTSIRSIGTTSGLVSADFDSVLAPGDYRIQVYADAQDGWASYDVAVVLRPAETVPSIGPSASLLIMTLLGALGTRSLAATGAA